MKSSNLLLIFPVVLLLSSCYSLAPEVRRYNSAMLSAAPGYMPKPASFDSSRNANYISAGYASNPQPQTNRGEQDEVRLANIAINRSHAFKALNFAYGVDGFLGSLRNQVIEQGEPEYFKTKGVYGYQFKTSVNATKSFKYSDFRWLGLDLYYSKEFGDFQEFRSQVPGTKDFLSVSNTGLFTAAISSEILLRARHSENLRYGFRFAIKHTFGDFKYQGVTTDAAYLKEVVTTYPNFTIFLQLKRYFLVLEGAESGRLNLGYRF